MTTGNPVLAKIWKSRETYCENKGAGFSTSCSIDDGVHICPPCRVHFALKSAVEGLARYQLGQGESVHSGIEMIPHLYGQYLDRSDVLALLEVGE